MKEREEKEMKDGTDVEELLDAQSPQMSGTAFSRVPNRCRARPAAGPPLPPHCKFFSSSFPSLSRLARYIHLSFLSYHSAHNLSKSPHFNPIPGIKATCRGSHCSELRLVTVALGVVHLTMVGYICDSWMGSATLTLFNASLGFSLFLLVR